MTIGEANEIRACLCCGQAGAQLLRLRDGRNVRACDACLRGSVSGWRNGATERDPLPCELEKSSPASPYKATAASLTCQGVHVYLGNMNRSTT